MTSMEGSGTRTNYQRALITDTLFTAEPVRQELDSKRKDSGFELKLHTAVEGQVTHSRSSFKISEVRGMSQIAV